MKREYLDLTRLVERLHRRFLDVLRVELNRASIKDINAVQALLLANIKDERIAIRDLIERGYYQGSNVSYNIKKLTDMGYLVQERSAHDKRSVSIQLTEKALEVVKRIRELEDATSGALVKNTTEAAEIETACASLRRLERIWADYINYGGD